MSLIRFVARSLFASAFVADGIGKLTKPSEDAADAEEFTNRVAPLVQRVVPAGYSSSVPVDPETWVRIGGAAQVLGGAMFATGIGRRLGALMLTGASVLNTAIALPNKDATKAERDASRPKVLQNVALLGASVIAAQDLQGKPSLSWRADHAAKRADKSLHAVGEDLSRKARKAAKKADKKAQKLARKARKQAKSLGKKMESVVS